MFNKNSSAGTAAQKRSKCSLFTLLPLLLAIPLLAAVISGCDQDPTDRVWYGNNGMRIEAKSTNDREYGKWKYYVRDNYGLILIRSNEEWNVGDTLYVSPNSR